MGALCTLTVSKLPALPVGALVLYGAHVGCGFMNRTGYKLPAYPKKYANQNAEGSYWEGEE